jgi:hypothetical protein
VIDLLGRLLERTLQLAVSSGLALLATLLISARTELAATPRGLRSRSMVASSASLLTGLALIA